MLVRRTAAAFAVSSAAFLAACGSANTVTVDDLAQMQARVEELERTNGRLRIRIQDTEERLFLLQDRVDANRVNVARRDTESFRQVRERSVAPRQYESPVTSSAPPPFPNVDPLVPNLPVQRLGPAESTAPVATAPVDDVPEVVIDQAAFDARFGNPSATTTPRPATRSTSSGSSPPQRQALPPVDVGSHRLPTASASGDDNRVASADASASPLEIYTSGVDLFNEAEYSQALDAMNRFVATGPQPDYMDNALYWMGECLYGLGRYDEALGFFQRVVSEYPDGNKVPDSLLKEALTHERLSNLSRAHEILTTLVETYPTTDAAERARQRLRDLEI